jgi:hypothetical protein
MNQPRHSLGDVFDFLSRRPPAECQLCERSNRRAVAALANEIDTDRRAQLGVQVSLRFDKMPQQLVLGGGQL